MLALMKSRRASLVALLVAVTLAAPALPAALAPMARVAAEGKHVLESPAMAFELAARRGVEGGELGEPPDRASLEI